VQRIELNSTALEAAIYQDQLGLLELEFRDGTVYQYHDVPAQTYQEFLLAESQGAYFHFHIRNRFSYAKVNPADPKTRIAPHSGSPNRPTR
jgi:hypothetical protein